MLQENAQAKLNLFLHVLGRRDDGYHSLESLVVFADVADRLVLEPGPDLGLTVTGPTARMAGPEAENLVTRAVRALQDRLPDLKTGHFTLDKHLPVAAGLGGGSSDAAAALRLVARLNGIHAEDPVLHEVALGVGADVPVCLAQKPRLMRGIGGDLGPALRLPTLACLLINPGVKLETRAVFSALGLSAGEKLSAPLPDWSDQSMNADDLLNFLATTRNDLQAAAIQIEPLIRDGLSALTHLDGCRIARMSGSGASCFGLFKDAASMMAAARTLRRNHSGWWIQPVML